MKLNDILSTPVDPFRIEPGSSVSDVLERMGRISFQGRNLSLAFHVWLNMLQDEVTIFFGLAGAMVPAGMRRIVLYLIENRLIDCIVSTGANLFHDVHETLGRYHYMGSAHADDNELKDLGVDRIYDTYAVEEEFYKADQFVAEVGAGLLDRAYSTREFLNSLGKRLSEIGKDKGILSAAAEHGIPVYCPAISDSSLGIALSILDANEGKKFQFDMVKDVTESARLAMTAKNTGVIYVGGGTPKNFIQQTEVTASYIGGGVEGHKYAVQFTADAPHWGGLSGCTFEEAQSWGKIHKEARMASVHVDSTIALPIVVSALAERQEFLKARRVPEFKF